jgi:hypothetical protein
MPIAAFIPLIAAGIGAGGSIAAAKIQSNASKNAIAARAASGGSSSVDSSDPFASLIESQKKMGEQSFAGSMADIATARGKLEASSNLYNAITKGTPDEVLQYLDASGATRQMDDNEQIASQLGVRGGQRAAVIGQQGFAKDAALNNLLKQFKFNAIAQNTDIGKAFGSLGVSEGNLATTASGQATQGLVSQAQIAAQQAAAKSNMIGGILGTVGSIAGVVLAKKLGGNNNNSTIYTGEDTNGPFSGGSIFGGSFPGLGDEGWPDLGTTDSPIGGLGGDIFGGPNT